MPIDTILDRTLGIAVQRVTVELRGDEVIAAQTRLYGDPEHSPSTPVLWDAREAVVTRVVFEEMRDMAAKAEPLYERMAGGRTAILVGSQADFGMGRMYQSLSAGMPRDLRVFDDYDAALAWLTETPSD